MRIELEDGLTIETATDADLEYVHDHLRPGDMVEHSFDRRGWDTVEHLPGVMVIRKNGDVIGYIGNFPPPNETVWSPRRVMYYLSTVNVEKYRLEYVRRTPQVFRLMAAELPEWVTEILTVSMPEDYPMACKWLERVLKFEPLIDYTWRGKRHRLYHKQRKDV